MKTSKKVILVCLAIFLLFIAIRLSIDFPTGLGIYSGNISATNPEGTIRFTTAPLFQVILIDPPDNTIYTIPGFTRDVNLTCSVVNLSSGINITQVKLYTDISGAYVITDTLNITNPPPFNVTFNLTAVPLGSYRWNCEAISSTNVSRFAPADWHFTIRRSGPTPTPGGGGSKAPYVKEEPAYLPCIIPPDNLTSWFTFDNNTDDFWNESHEGLTFEKPKYFKGADLAAMKFNGFSDQVIISPDNVFNNIKEGTIDGWVYYKKKVEPVVIFSYADASQNDKHLLLQILPSGNIEFKYKDGSDYRIVAPETLFNFMMHRDTWVHFALTYNNTEYEWYFDGIKYGANVQVSGNPGFWFNDLKESVQLTGAIGALIGKGQITNQFKGGLDEIEIFDRALTSKEVYDIQSRLKCKISTRCGDGILQAYKGEECDDGNTISGDYCSAACKIEYCGDGVLQPSLGEECEPPLTEYCGVACEILVVPPEAEIVRFEQPKVYLPERVIPWWLLGIAVLAIAAVFYLWLKATSKPRQKTAEPVVKRITVKKQKKQSKRKKKKK